MIAYFARLNLPRLILWCYLAWYIAIVVRYFDASPMLWISSLGISIVIGIALNLATHQPEQGKDRWMVFRLFLIPFCVSSYAALIKDKGFILVFPPDGRSLLAGVAACLAMLSLHAICRVIHSHGRRAGA